MFREWGVKNPEKRLYLVVVQGDKHHFEGMDNQDGTSLIVPSLIGGETYSQQSLALSSPAGYMICGNRGDGKFQSFYNETIRLA